MDNSDCNSGEWMSQDDNIIKSRCSIILSFILHDIIKLLILIHLPMLSM